MARAVVMGNIHVVDDPESEGRDSAPQEFKYSILIQFENGQQVREALETGSVNFDMF